MEKMQLNNLKYQKVSDDFAKVMLGGSCIGHISRVSDYYDVTICYHDFKIKVAHKRFMSQLISNVFLRQKKFWNIEEKNIPLRINGSLKPIPKGTANKVLA